MAVDRPFGHTHRIIISYFDLQCILYIRTLAYRTGSKSSGALIIDKNNMIVCLTAVGLTLSYKLVPYNTMPVD